MRILEVDAGNTCIKWRLIDYKEKQNEKIRSDHVFAPVSIEVFPDSFCLQLKELKQAGIKEIRASNVRGENFKNSFSLFCNEQFALKVNYATVQAEFAGLKNAYQDFATLGVDRWLAMLAAYKAARSAVCIVDCGSAMTIDLLNAEGQHEGGFIVPGIQLMQRSLGEHTANLPYQPDPNTSFEPGKKTTEAINHGVLNMTLGMMEKVRRQWGHDQHWYLCGGDAALLSPFITWQHEHRPELVLEGLALVCTYSENGDNEQ